MSFKSEPLPVLIYFAPQVSVVAFDSDQFNIYGLADGMKERGWSLNSLQFPICVHFCVTRNRLQLTTIPVTSHYHVY